MNKKYRILLEDILSGKRVWSNYSFLNQSQWWSEDLMQEYRTEKLGRLIQHCYRFVPAYKSIIDQSGLDPENIRSIDDVKKLPVLDKQYILDNYNDFVSTHKYSKRGIRIKKTSGTTGQVLVFRNDPQTRSMVWGSFMRFKDWMGYNHKSPYIVFSGRDIMKKGGFSDLRIKIADIIGNSRTLDSYDLGDDEISSLINLLNRYPGSVIRGYVLNIVDVAVILKRSGLSFSIQAVSTTAEPLLDFHRRTIEETFNCGIFDQYGCGEVGGVAYECDHHSGLHITEEHVILETNDSDEIVLTDLDNYIFPFIRYKNGDKATMSEKSCSCGRKSQLISELQGRTSENIIGMDGLPVHWGYFHHLLIYTKIATERNLIKFQVIQESVSHLTLKIVSDPLTESDITLLTKVIKEKFGPVSVSVINVEDILKDANGKFRAIISNVKF